MRIIILLFLFASFFSKAQSVDAGLKTLTASGTNTYTISEALPAAYDPKERFLVRFTNANSGASTLNRAGLGAKDIKKIGGTALSSGDIPAGATLLISYNGTYYQIIGDGGSGGGGGSTTFAALTDVSLTSLATNDFLKWDGTDWINRTPTNVRTDLGLVIGTNVQAYDADLTTYAGITPSANIQSFLGAADYSAMRTQMGLVIGTNVQAYDADLTTWAGITPSTIGTSVVSSTNPSAVTFLRANADNTSTWLSASDFRTAIGAGTGSGTVTSVGWTGGIVSIANATTTPAFTIAGTSGGIPYFSGATTWASSGALAANALVIGGGAGVAPSTTTTGTGVLTALGVNVGSAGAFLTFNGAGGTPSSLTGTNITGTAAGLTAGNVTTNANLTGDVTSVGNATTLATVNGNVGSFGNATSSLTATVNAKGLITAISSQTVTPAVGSITGLGTGVATALAVNVGSSGAFVVNGGALGTPSSGTLTNATGYLWANLTGTGTPILASAVTIGTGATAGHQITANSLTTGDGLSVSTTSGTSGSIARFASTSTVTDHTAGTSGLFEVASSGANSTASKTAIGISSIVTNTGTTSTNYAAYFGASGATTNRSIYASGAIQVDGTSSITFSGAATETLAASQAAALTVTDGTTTFATYKSTATKTITFAVPTAIGGTATNDAAAAGYVGERFTSSQSTYTNFTTTATYQNITSIALTAGDWDISAFFTYSSNSATITAASNSIFVISTTTASAAGATEGINIAYIPQAALLGTSFFSEGITPYRVSLSATTTYYLNAQATFTLGNPQFVGTIRAVRVR